MHLLLPGGLVENQKEGHGETKSLKKRPMVMEGGRWGGQHVCVCCSQQTGSSFRVFTGSLEAEPDPDTVSYHIEPHVHDGNTEERGSATRSRRDLGQSHYRGAERQQMTCFAAALQLVLSPRCFWRR